MALVLRSNPSSLGRSTGALFVSNPRKRKPNRKTRRNAKKVARKNTSRKKRVIRMKRKNPVRKKRVVRRRKNGTKKGMVRKTARRAYTKRKNAAHKKVRRNAIKMKRKNPVRRRKSSRRRSRMNPMRKMMRKNPVKGLVPSLVKSVKGIVSKIPYVGKPIADNLLVSVSGMLGGLAFVASYNYLSGKLDEQSAKMPDSFIIKSLNATNKYAGYALLGVLGKVVSKQKFAKDLLGAQTADLVGNGILMAGGLFQAIRYYNIYAGKYGKQQLELKEAPALSGIHMGRYGRYGDGGSYDVVPLAGMHMNGAHMAGIHMNGAHMSGAHMHGAHMHGAHMHGVHKMGLIKKNTNLGAIHMGRSYSGLVVDSPMSGLVVDNMAGLAVVGTAV